MLRSESLIKLSIWRRLNSSSSSWVNRQQHDHFTREAKVQNLRSRAAFKLMEIDDRFKIFKRDVSQNVLDLGFAPGAWSQVAYERTSSNGRVLGIDILPCKPPKGVSSLQANILSRKTHELVRLYFSKHYQLNVEDDLHRTHGYFQHMLEEKLDELNCKDQDRIGSVIEYPLDVIISDMYEPWPQTTGFWSNLTNTAYNRMANTTGVAIKDHYMSMDLCDAALVCAIDLLKPGGKFVCKLYTGKEDLLLENRLKKVFKEVQRVKPMACRDESKESYFVGTNKKDKVDKIKVFVQ